MPTDLRALRSTVQRNCDISDAEYARDFTMCIYLLKMREYYRWEKGFGYSDALPREDLGRWLQEREQRWEALEDEALAPLPVGEGCVDPFDTAAVNAALLPEGFVYSGGYGRAERPHFFLAELLRSEQREGFAIHVSAREHARDLVAPPAMMLDRTIFVRRESIRRMVWEKLEEWQWRKTDGAMARAVACYAFEADLEHALEAMTDHVTDAVILHEIGEAQAGELLGRAWHDMLHSVARSRAELVARAVRDHLADCLSTLPQLLERSHAASLHFYLANLEGVRKELFPGLMVGYQRWVDGDGMRHLADAVSRGRDHWLALAQQMLALHRERGDACAQGIDALLETGRLTARQDA
jgi:hypothetical protein